MSVSAEILFLQLPAAVAALSGAFDRMELAKLLFCLAPALIFLLVALAAWSRERHWRHRCAELTEAEQLRREKLSGLEALAQSMAELGHMRCFLTAPDEREVLFEAGEEGAWLGRFQPPGEYVHRLVPEDRERFLELWRRLLSGETGKIDFHYHAGQTGAPALFAERAEVLTTPGGKRRLLTVVSADFSALERSGRELAEADRMLGMIFDHLPLPVFTRDASGNFAYSRCNVAFAALFGMTPEEIVGKNDPELLHAPEFELKIRLGELELARGGGSCEHDWEFPREDGTLRVYRFRECLLERADGNRIILGIGRELPRRRDRAAAEAAGEDCGEK